jgi:hypothetical protein
VYDASEALFARLEGEARKLCEWAALAWAEADAMGGGCGTGGGQDALEALVEAGCNDVADWEANLRGLKVRGRVRGLFCGWVGS